MYFYGDEKVCENHGSTCTVRMQNGSDLPYWHNDVMYCNVGASIIPLRPDSIEEYDLDGFKPIPEGQANICREKTGFFLAMNLKPDICHPCFMYDL